MLVFHCNCRDCQRAGGSLFHFGVMLPEASLTLEGTLTSYTSKSDAGREITRSFCGTCGSGVVNRLQMAPGMVVVRGGTLDDPAALKPTFELYTRAKPHWVRLSDDIRAFEAGDIGSPAELIWHS